MIPYDFCLFPAQFCYIIVYIWKVKSCVQIADRSGSESELLYDWRFTANQFVLASSPLRHTARIFFSQLNTCGHIPYITSSLMREWVCHLQLLPAFANAFILGFESRGTHDHILMFQIRDFPFCRLLRLAGLWWRYSTPPPHGWLRTGSVLVLAR
jgi:hypothetical protein